MKMIRRFSLVFAIGLFALMGIAAHPGAAGAAGKPHIQFVIATKTYIDSAGKPYTLHKIMVEGSNFTPHGGVRVSVRGLQGNRVIDVQTTTANSNGAFTLALDNVLACQGGPQEKVVALDGTTNTIANYAYPNVCPFL